MNAATINQGPEPDATPLTEATSTEATSTEVPLTEAELGEKSLRAARFSIWGLAGWYELLLLLTYACIVQAPQRLLWLQGIWISLIVGTLLRALWQWRQTRRTKFRYIDVPVRGGPRRFYGRVLLMALLFCPGVCLIFPGLLAILLYLSGAPPHIVHLPEALFFLIIGVIVWVYVWLSALQKRIILADDSLIIQISGKPFLILYRDIAKVEAVDGNDLHIQLLSLPNLPILLPAFGFGERTLVFVAQTIHQRAPQATFGLRADLMRRGYVSW